MYNGRTDETETVILCVCEPMTLADLISMTLEDLTSSHVYHIYVCVVSLITKLFRKFKPICLLFKSLRKRRLSYLQSAEDQEIRGFNPCETEQSRA